MTGYRFVADLLDSRHDVAEYGCAASLGTEMVLQKVRKITVYDSDPAVLTDLHRQFPEDWPFETHVHDILSSPLPNRHDAIYCLDNIQHISRSDEDIYVRHLRDSLSRNHDILIIGSPSFDEEESALPLRSGTAVFSRTAAELRALLERHFYVVFPFSLAGEVMHAGIHPAADYVFALCCMAKG